jgi:hypothetical protein
MGLILVLGPAVSPCGGAEDGDPFDFAAYGSRVEAFENVGGPDAPWEYPYAAPRPAGLSDQEMKTTLALRRRVLDGSHAELETLAEQVERRQDAFPLQMRFWLAFAQSELHLNEACLGNLRKILGAAEGWDSLENGQQAWVLTATADLLFLLGQRTQAASCYDLLAASPVTQLNLWGQYQLAGMDFLAREFETAARRYQIVCDADRPGTWREHACGMTELATRLGQLVKGGNVHGELASSPN